MNKVISILITLFGLYIIVSCSNEEGLSLGPNRDDKRTVFLKITVPGSPSHSMTRATSEIGSDIENFIDNVYITIHSQNKGDYKKVFTEQWTKGNEAIGGVNKTFPCKVDASWFVGSGDLTATVYANYSKADIPGRITDESTFWGGDNLNTLKKLFMSGSAKINMYESETGDETYSGTVEIQRQVAKLRLKIQVTDDCVPVGLTILYDSVRVAVTNIADRADTITSHAFDQEYINFKERGGDSLRISKVKGGVVDSCYIFENMIKDYPVGKRTTMKVTVPTYDPVANHREDLYGSFEIKGEDAGSYDLKRNYIYTVIVKVRSQREPLYMNSIVQPWNVRSQEEGPLEPISK